MTLSQEQINIIRNVVEGGKITTSTLRDDLIDHLCCEVEYRLSRGLSFDESMEIALVDLAPKGLKQIQRDTNILLHTKTEINMKRITYGLGLITTMTMSLGWLLNVLRFGEMANMLFAVGALGFVALFLPLIAFEYFRSNQVKKVPEKLRMATGVLSLIMVGIAVLFKIMHLPGADEVLMAGGVVFTFGFLPSVFFILYRKSVSQMEG
jgi:hypothetical protein